jgi:adenylate cyclase class 1
MGTHPLSAKIRDRGVLISDRTDAFQFGGQGINLVQSVDLLMMTSWEEVLVFSFEGTAGLLDALMEYLQWATPLGSVELPLLKICCLSQNHAHAIQGRVENYAREVVDMLCHPESGVDRQLVTQFEQQYCRVFAKNNRPQYELHRNLLSLSNALSAPKAKFSTVKMDAGCSDLGALSVIYVHNRAEFIQLFVREAGKDADIYILDEFGALFTHRQECFRIETIFDQYAQFLQNLLKHHIQRIDSAGKLSGQPQLETFRLQAKAGGAFQALKVTAPTPRGNDYFSVRVFVDVHKGGNQQFTIFCEDEEFSSAEHGGRLFIAIAEYVMTRRGNAETYPIYITDLELSNRFKKFRNIDTLQTIHVLNYKKRIEQQLTRALRVDLMESKKTQISV